MSLSKWNQYLYENNCTLVQAKQESHLSGIIDYFSAPNLIDTFNGYGDFNVNLHYLNPSILSDLKKAYLKNDIKNIKLCLKNNVWIIF